MEPTVMDPEIGVPSAARKPSRIKAGVAAILIAGALSTWGRRAFSPAGSYSRSREWGRGWR